MPIITTALIFSGQTLDFIFEMLEIIIPSEVVGEIDPFAHLASHDREEDRSALFMYAFGVIFQHGVSLARFGLGEDL